MKNHSIILRLAKYVTKPDAGFLFALVGVIVQTWHTGYITFDLSALDGWQRTVQAILMGIFVSGALLYYIVKAAHPDPKLAKKYMNMVFWFAVLESFINLYYWTYNLVVKPWPDVDWLRFMISVPFSIMLPVILKSYGGEVRIYDVDDNNANTVPTSIYEKIEIIESSVQQLKSLEMNTSINSDDITQMINDKAKIAVEEHSKELFENYEKLYISAVNKLNDVINIKVEEQVNERILQLMSLRAFDTENQELSDIDISKIKTEMKSELTKYVNDQMKVLNSEMNDKMLEDLVKAGGVNGKRKFKMMFRNNDKQLKEVDVILEQYNDGQTKI